MDAHQPSPEDIIALAVSRLAHEDNLKDMCHLKWRGEPLPSRRTAGEIVDLCRALIFPGFFGGSEVNRNNIVYHCGILCERLYGLLSEQVAAGLYFNTPHDRRPDMSSIRDEAGQITCRVIGHLPELREILTTDVKATFIGDPAATSTDEVIYCYPGILAISSYRIAHELMKERVPIIPRLISELAHGETGIDIHPGAQIGRSFTIDHGTGVVIGATSIIGHNVKLYQGVTLGAKSFDVDTDGNPVKGIPRHPMIGDNVIIYSNATILGRVTIGDGAIIGGNVWVTRDVAPGEKLIQGDDGPADDTRQRDKEHIRR